jgi:tRNA(Arg) A34 adenosine deaminase TadA
MMLTETELGYLRQAIALARSAREHGNHPFGALLVDAHGRVLAEAENTVITESDCTGHAETNLVRLASARFDRETLAGSTLYTSTEPCAMCAGAIHWSGVGRVVFGLSEENLYELTGVDPSNETLRLPCREVFARSRRPIEVIGPLLQEQSEAVHHGFWSR